MFLRLANVLMGALWLTTTMAAFPGEVLSLEDVFLGAQGDDTRIIGRDSRDNSGSALAVGDVTGDGIEDVVIGIPASNGINNSEQDAGEVALIFGARGLPTAIQLIDADRTFYGATAYSNLGNTVAVGDVDGNGVGDIIMGAPKADSPVQGGAGAVYVFYGGTGLPLVRNVDLEQVPVDIVLYGGQDAGRLGAYAAAGDFNGDGFDDFAVAAPQEGLQFDRRNAGVIYVFFGAPDLDPDLEVTIGRTPPFTLFPITTILGPHAEARAGRPLAAGDINGDGLDDLLVGVTVGARPGDPGEVHILFGGGAGLEPKENQLVEIDLKPEAGQVDLRILGPSANDWFGLAIGVADINGDEIQDILIGAPSSVFASGLVTGRAYAVFGGAVSSGTVRDLAVEKADVTLIGPHDGADLGSSITGGDLNDDGIDEWIVGSPGADRFGQAYRVLGRTAWSPAGAVGSLTQGTRWGDEAGRATVVGDVSGDGIGDLILSSPLFDGEPFSSDTRNTGAVYILRGVQQTYPPSPDCTDDDQDGFHSQGRTCGPKDCDDDDPLITWRVDDTCTDCDQLAAFDGTDADADGWPRKATSICIIPDCNDNNPNVNPAVTEICDDGIDNNCDDAIDAADPTCCESETEEICNDDIDNDCDRAIDSLDTECGGPGCPDADDDGFSPGDGACGPVDCDDTDAEVNPWAREICNDGLDNDCDGAIDALDTDCGGPGCTDADHDASCVPADCNDRNPAVNPRMSEICNDGLDNDCDGAIDALDTDCGGPGCDGDGDGICPPADCDDVDPDINPGTLEICDDGEDNDCDGATDETDTSCGGPGCDGDGDGICPPADCDDGAFGVNPWMTEICDDGADNDCDGAADESDTECPTSGMIEVCTNCVDDNGDGLGDLLDSTCARTSLTLKALVSGRVRKLPVVVKRVRIKTRIEDSALLTDPSSATSGLTVGLAFDDGTQLCLPLDRVKRARKRKLVVRSSSGLKAKLRLKLTPQGHLKLRYKQKGKLRLKDGTATAIAFGVYGANHSYNGEVSLRAKNARKLASVKVSK